MTTGGQSQHGDDAHRILETAVGGTVTIHLWEDRTRGEQWVPSYNAKALALVDDEYLRIAGNNAVDNGRRTFLFMGMIAGSHDIVFEKRMGWKFTSEDRQVVTVHVATGGKG